MTSERMTVEAAIETADWWDMTWKGLKDEERSGLTDKAWALQESMRELHEDVGGSPWKALKRLADRVEELELTVRRQESIIVNAVDHADDRLHDRIAELQRLLSEHVCDKTGDYVNLSMPRGAFDDAVKDQTRSKTTPAVGSRREGVRGARDMNLEQAQLKEARQMLEAMGKEAYSLKQERDAARAEAEWLQKRVAELEEMMSEVVAPDIEGEEWVEILDDGTGIPIMRGSPRLPAYILALHRAIDDPSIIDRCRAEGEQT